MARNPYTLVKRPAVRKREAKHLDAHTVSAVLKAAEGLRYYRVLVLIAATGLRRGEALGLHWEHVNLRDGSLRVAATVGRIGKGLTVTEPKTERSRRTVPLSSYPSWGC
ncbi:tyrosine-type recombinase/integrase [Mycobacterium sp. 23]|uniref:tyrosine-type recombinase/integrase n=1 Tax=Mycobacterium sp. 23 TaxID=3400424 RepID=UPI003AAC0902